jgi:hypothetical protein
MSFGFNESNRAAQQEAEARVHASAAEHNKVRIVGAYINNKTKVGVECLTCAHTWDSFPKNIHAGHGCQPCAAEANGKARRLPEAELIRRQELKENTALVNKFNRLVDRYCQCRDDALKYISRTDWQSNSKSTYSSALRNGWLDTLCSHMLCGKSPASGLPAQTYVLEHWTPDGTVINVGRTQRSIKGRYTVGQLADVTRRYVLPFTDGADAYALEQATHKLLADYLAPSHVTVAGKSGKELFSCTFEQAVEAVRQASREKLKEALTV